jgi:UDP-2,3-diacylglucosamine hydrolase
MYYFISDIHLGYNERSIDKKREDIFLNLLDKIALDCQTLFLVGDVFDYWFEYKTVIPKEFYRTISKLSELKDKGIKIEYIMGNHDFGHRDFFEKELNIKIYREDIERELDGKKFYISHGDGKSHKDLGYKLLKKLLRSSWANFLYRIIHPDIGIGVASGSSKSSRKFTGDKDYGESDGMQDFAFSKISEGFDFVIMGHRHIAEFTEYENGAYVNLGEWFERPTFGVYSGGEFKLLEVQDFLSE